MSGFAVTWTAGALSGFIDSISDAGRRLAGAGETIAIAGPLMVLLGKLVTLLGTALSWLIRPLIWLREQIQASGNPVWVDFLASAAIISALLFLLFGLWLLFDNALGWPWVAVASTAGAAGIAVITAVARYARSRRSARDGAATLESSPKTTA